MQTYIHKIYAKLIEAQDYTYSAQCTVHVVANKELRMWIHIGRRGKSLYTVLVKCLVAWCHSFCLFFIFYNIHTYIHTITFIRRHSLRPLSISSSLVCSVGKPPCGAEPRIELGPALQQADALPTELRRTITVLVGFGRATRLCAAGTRLLRLINTQKTMRFAPPTPIAPSLLYSLSL